MMNIQKNTLKIDQMASSVFTSWVVAPSPDDSLAERGGVRAATKKAINIPISKKESQGTPHSVGPNGSIHIPNVHIPKNRMRKKPKMKEPHPVRKNHPPKTEVRNIAITITKIKSTKNIEYNLLFLLLFTRLKKIKHFSYNFMSIYSIFVV